MQFYLVLPYWKIYTDNHSFLPKNMHKFTHFWLFDPPVQSGGPTVSLSIIKPYGLCLQ